VSLITFQLTHKKALDSHKKY